jgi:hypothetical protein
MRNSYTVNVPPTRDQGNTTFSADASYMETMRKNALWTYNKMREHDGQEPLSRMPKGTKYIRNKAVEVAYENAKEIVANDEPWFGDLVWD